MGYDYKEILKRKAEKLNSLLAKYGESIDPDLLNEYKILINNTIELSGGRLDALDYDVREEGIRNYDDKLGQAIGSMERRFEPKEDKEEER